MGSFPSGMVLGLRRSYQLLRSLIRHGEGFRCPISLILVHSFGIGSDLRYRCLLHISGVGCPSHCQNYLVLDCLTFEAGTARDATGPAPTVQALHRGIGMGFFLWKWQ